MKKQLIRLLSIASITMISTLSFAGSGGESCDAHKGEHKGLSAEAFKDFNKNHSWLKNHGHDEMDKSAGQDDKVKKTDVPSTGGLIES